MTSRAISIKQHGYFLVIGVFFILVMAFMGLLIAYLFANRAALSAAQLNGLQTFYHAESGLEIGSRLLSMPALSGTPSRIACGNLSGNSAVTNASMGSGKLTVTTINSSPIFATNTLSSAMGSTDTTLTVASSSGFASSGRILIDKEAIDYAALSGNTFVGVARGVAGTSATSHANGASVGQYQCSLDSQAGIPNLTSPNYQRELQSHVQLQDGWLVGDTAPGRNMVFARWNNPSEMAWTSSFITLSVNVNLRDVYMLSYTDGWAVGSAQSSNLTFYHWDGSAWTRVLPAVSINNTLNSVYCNASNDCWAVGAANSSNPIIERWNGSTWTRVLPTVNVNTALNAVYCNSSSDCWAVGATNSSNPLIERWNGSTWSRVLPTVSVNAALNAVYCNNSNDCWAVGARNSSNPLIERWNGSTWSRVLPASSVNAALNGIYCNSTTDCWAVGDVLSSNTLFIEHWDGTNWSQASPSVSGTTNLYGVACVNPSDCWAVGQNSTVVHYDGTAWSIVSIGGGFPSVILRAVSLIGAKQNPLSHWQQIFG